MSELEKPDALKQFVETRELIKQYEKLVALNPCAIDSALTLSVPNKVGLDSIFSMLYDITADSSSYMIMEWSPDDVIVGYSTAKIIFCTTDEQKQAYKETLEAIKEDKENPFKYYHYEDLHFFDYKWNEIVTVLMGDISNESAVLKDENGRKNSEIILYKFPLYQDALEEG